MSEISAQKEVCVAIDWVGNFIRKVWKIKHPNGLCNCKGQKTFTLTIEIV